MWNVVHSVRRYATRRTLSLATPRLAAGQGAASNGSVGRSVIWSGWGFSGTVFGTGTACCVSKDPAFCPRSVSCAWCVYQSKPVRLLTSDAVWPFVRSQLNFCVLFGLISFFNDGAMAKAVISALSPWAPEFDPRLVSVVFVVDRVALGQVFLPVLRFSPVIIIVPFLHPHIYLHVAVIRWTNGRSVGTFQQQYYFGNRESQDVRCFRLSMLSSVK
jgi:hypothetical protein